MYLSEEELKSFIERMLGWLKPGGFLFFRESCNHRSGNQRTAGQQQHLNTGPKKNNTNNNKLDVVKGLCLPEHFWEGR